MLACDVSQDRVRRHAGIVTSVRQYERHAAGAWWRLLLIKAQIRIQARRFCPAGQTVRQLHQGGAANQPDPARQNSGERQRVVYFRLEKRGVASAVRTDKVFVGAQHVGPVVPRRLIGKHGKCVCRHNLTGLQHRDILAGRVEQRRGRRSVAVGHVNRQIGKSALLPQRRHRRGQSGDVRFAMEHDSR